MTPQYYTPSIEEFYVGFEYEEKWEMSPPVPNEQIKSKYKKVEWRATVFGNSIDVYELVRIQRILRNIYHSYVTDRAGYLRMDKIRVKYLDQSDIEAEGWICYAMGEAMAFRDSSNNRLYLYPETHYVTICRSNKQQMVAFHGVIRNRSELKKVLKMLEIA